MIWPGRGRKSRALVRIAYLITTGILAFGAYRQLFPHDRSFSVWGQERFDAGKGVTFAPTSTLRRSQASWKGLTTAIVEFAPYHEEVWGSVLHSFTHMDANLGIYRPPYRFSFGGLIDSTTASLNIDPTSMNDAQHALKRLARNELDVIVITSGDKYWVDNSTRQALVEAKHTMVVLFIHHAQSLLVNLERETLHEVAGQGRLCLLGLSPHTTEMIRATVGNWSIVDEKVAWDKTLIDTFLPVFPSPHTGDEGLPHHIRKPARIGIQGRIEYTRRDYEKIFKDLLNAIQGDPSAWGLAPVTTASKTVFQPSSKDSLSLNLIGEHVGGVQWPEELAEIVHVHSGLAYAEYYEILGTMDLMVPAFVDGVYLVERASSSIPAAIMSKVPLLVNPAHLRAYSYLDAPAVRLHPGGMSVVEAIRMLRADQDPWSGEEDYEPAEMGTFWGHERAPRERSRASGDWDGYIGSIYESNQVVWDRISAKLMRRRIVNSRMD